jgi:hypothetical protein
MAMRSGNIQYSWRKLSRRSWRQLSQQYGISGWRSWRGVMALALWLNIAGNGGWRWHAAKMAIHTSFSSASHRKLASGAGSAGFRHMAASRLSSSAWHANTMVANLCGVAILNG